MLAEAAAAVVKRAAGGTSSCDAVEAARKHAWYVARLLLRLRAAVLARSSVQGQTMHLQHQLNYSSSRT